MNFKTNRRPVNEGKRVTAAITHRAEPEPGNKESLSFSAAIVLATVYTSGMYRLTFSIISLSSPSPCLPTNHLPLSPRPRRFPSQPSADKNISQQTLAGRLLPVLQCQCNSKMKNCRHFSFRSFILPFVGRATVARRKSTAIAYKLIPIVRLITYVINKMRSLLRRRGFSLRLSGEFDGSILIGEKTQMSDDRFAGSK